LPQDGQKGRKEEAKETWQGRKEEINKVPPHLQDLLTRKGKAMFSRIRKRCTYANVTATMALFFAISGGAYAASKYLITSTKQISPTVLTSLKGKAGPAGKNGANGANGPAGPTGPQGPAGANGSSGANGESVTNTALAKGNFSCKEGGAEFTVGSTKTYACNGKSAKGGGFPATLPAGKTEQGTWSVALSIPHESEGKAQGYSSISFTIPLAASLSNAGCFKKEAPCQIHYINSSNEEVTLAGNVPNEGACKEGNAKEPKAEAGNLCVYTREESALETFKGAVGIAPGGATLHFYGTSLTEEGYAFGSWAVTAPAEEES
jgi:hypothetical protein